jgi:hypothetical protein
MVNLSHIGQIALPVSDVDRSDEHDLWMAFFTDPGGHTLALMQEAPKGHLPREG